MAASFPVYLRNGEEVKVNDHVYCSPAWSVRDGTPYSIARIMEFLPPEGTPKEEGKHFLYTRVRLAWYYRPIDLTDRPVSDCRVLLAAIYSEICDINQLRGVCYVLHKSKIPDLNAWKKRPDCFYYTRLFDPYIKREFEVIPSEDVRNIPNNVRETLISRYEFVIAEKEVIPDLTDAIRLCQSCEEWCSSAESVQCDRCKHYFHMRCVQPPLLAKPARGYGWTCAPCSRQHEKEVDNREVRHLTPKGAPPRPNPPTTRGRGRPRREQMGSEADLTKPLRYYKMWPFRYFGHFTVAEDTVDPEDIIFPRAATRVGPRFQATVTLGTDLTPASELKHGQRGGDDTIELFGLVHTMSEEEVTELEKCKAKLPGTRAQRTNVDYLTELIRRYSVTHATKGSLAAVNMESPMRTDKWTQKERSYLERTWNQQEIAAFEDGIAVNGAELRAISEDIPTRTMPEIVRYYGHWKAGKLGEENARIRKLGIPAKRASQEPLTAAQAAIGQHVGPEDDNESIVTRPTKSICGACRTRDSPLWWKAPKNVSSDVLCDNCGINYRKYADLASRVTRDDSSSQTKKTVDKREGTPLTAPGGSKRARTAASETSTPPPTFSGPGMHCLLCRKEGPVTKMVRCKKCQFTVHAASIGAAEPPSDNWLCDICENKDTQEAHLDAMCLLCPRERKDSYTDNFKPHPNSGLRACKPTEGQGWTHLICAIFLSELTFGDPGRMKPVEGINAIPPARWTRRCRLCGSVDGAVVRCLDCPREFHVSCAWRQEHRLGFEFVPPKGNRRDSPSVTFKGETGAMSAVITCKEHDRKKHKIYGLCEADDETGETALQIYCRLYKQAPVEEAHGLLRKARRLDQVLSLRSAPHAELSKPTDPKCVDCNTEFSPMFYPISGQPNQWRCHRCNFDLDKWVQEMAI